MDKALTAKASIGIQKPIDDVFEAIVNPDIMKNYFISESTGKLESGKEIQWKFPEFDAWYPITVREVSFNQQIIFEWDPNSTVKIELVEQTDKSTVIKVIEEGYSNNEAGTKWAIGQTEGWANFLACMKAWIEYQIPLRKGAFDFMTNN